MQRIGSLAMVTPENAFYRENWVKSGARPSPPQGGRFQERGVLPDLANAILAYAAKGGSMGEVNRAVDRVNKAFVEKFGGGAAAPPAQDQLAYAARSVNAGVQEVLDRGMASLPKRPRKGSVRVSNGRLVFVSDKNASEGIVGGASGLGGDSGPLLFSLAGAGVGYAVSRKNRGMSAGVGALVGFLAARYFSTPATPVSTPATPGTGYVGAVADVVTEFSTTLADNGYSVSAPRESTVIVDDNRFDGSAVTVLHPPEKSSLVANLARAKASKYGINPQARGALQVKPTDGGSVVIFADV